jgi:hypothetical protein
MCPAAQPGQFGVRVNPRDLFADLDYAVPAPAEHFVPRRGNCLHVLSTSATQSFGAVTQVPYQDVGATVVFTIVKPHGPLGHDPTLPSSG